MSFFSLTDSQKRLWRGGVTFCLALFLLLAPVLVLHAQVTSGTGLVPCDGPRSVAGSDARTCNFQSLFKGLEEIIKWMFFIAIPLSLVSFAYAGILFMSGKEANISTGKEIFTKVIWGLVFMAGGWLLVHTIVGGLLDPDKGFRPYFFGI